MFKIKRKAGSKCHCGKSGCKLKYNGKVTLDKPLEEITNYSDDVLGIAESNGTKYEIRHKNNAFVMDLIK